VDLWHLDCGFIAFKNDRNPYVQNSQHMYFANNLIYGSYDLRVHYAASTCCTTATMIAYVARGQSSNPNSYFMTVTSDPPPGSMVYIEDNACDTGIQSDPNDWDTCVRYWSAGKQDAKVLSPVDIFSEFRPISSSLVLDYVVDNAGAFPAYRDQTDLDLINRVVNRTGSLIDAPEDLPNPYSNLAQNTRTLGTQMPASVGPIPSNPDDDSDVDGYTNLHEWLLCLACEVEGRFCADCTGY
jgi:hypothetical protein